MGDLDGRLWESTFQGEPICRRGRRVCFALSASLALYASIFKVSADGVACSGCGTYSAVTPCSCKMANWVRDNLGRSDLRHVSTAQTWENTSGFCQTVMLPSCSLLARLYQWLLASWSGSNLFIWVECAISLCFSFPLWRLLLVVAGWLIAAEKWCSAAECAALCCRRYYDPLHTFLVLKCRRHWGNWENSACMLSLQYPTGVKSRCICWAAFQVNWLKEQSLSFKILSSLVRLGQYYCVVPWGEVSLQVYLHIRKDACNTSCAKCLSSLCPDVQPNAFLAVFFLLLLLFDKRLVCPCPLTDTIYLSKEKKAVS